MNPHFQQLIIQSALGKKSGTGGPDGKRPNRFTLAKSVYRFKALLRRNIKNGLLILIGVLSAGFGLEGFLLPNKFIDGGATGISLLISELSKWPLSLIIVIINIPFIVIGYHQMGRLFAIKTSLAILALAMAIYFVPYPIVTSDKLLVSVFGGFFLGAGIGFAMRGGAVLDGTEVLAIFISRNSSATIGDVIMGINVIIFSTAAWLLGRDTALYSMLAYLAASRTVDFLIEGIEEYTGVTIISVKSAEIGKAITEKLGRGITVYHGKGGYGKRGYQERDTEILFTVITRLEITKLRTEVELIDPHAFVVMSSIKDTKGGMIKKRPMKE